MASEPRSQSRTSLPAHQRIEPGQDPARRDDDSQERPVSTPIIKTGVSNLGQSFLSIITAVVAIESEQKTEVPAESDESNESSTSTSVNSYGEAGVGSRQILQDIDEASQDLNLSGSEQILAQWACSLLQTDFIQGILYMSNRNVIFFAPPVEHTIEHFSGYLYVRSSKAAKFQRYWARFNQASLSCHVHPADIYFPQASINLLKVDAVALTQDGLHGLGLSISLSLDDRVWEMRADSQSLTRSWYTRLQEAIVALRANRDKLVIRLPIDRIIDVEDSPMIERVETIKIRVLEDDGTFAVDEYFFSVFNKHSSLLGALKDRVAVPQSETLEPSHEQRSQDVTDREAGHIAKETFPKGTPKTSQELGSFNREEGDDTRSQSPYRKALDFAAYMRIRSKQVGDQLYSDSVNYVERFNEMWIGEGKHYDESESALSAPRLIGESEKIALKQANYGHRFRAHFNLTYRDKLQASYYTYLHRMIPTYGKIYLSNHNLCFRSLLPGTRTKLILPLRDIEDVVKESGFRFGFAGLIILIKAHEDLFFEFKHPSSRDDLAVKLIQTKEAQLSESDQEHRANAGANAILPQSSCEIKTIECDIEKGDKLFSKRGQPFLQPRNLMWQKVELNLRPLLRGGASIRFTCLTIGSRGDVQPFIALCKGLIAEGHRAKIATHQEFGQWIKGHGVDFAPIDGDPAELMHICVEHGMFTLSFLKEASAKFRDWIDSLLVSAWSSCQGSDVLIESPSAMAGIHIAEALQIPYFRAFSMPWTRTRAYPHAFAVPEHRRGGSYNYLTYVMFENVFWRAIASQINRWRHEILSLPITNLDKLQSERVPFLYNFSPAVVAPPLDFNQWTEVTGYWFLDEGKTFKPPEHLTSFIAKARADKKKIVYIGFGSIVVADSRELTQTIAAAVRKADVRAILSKGWCDRLNEKPHEEAQETSISEILLIKSAPHDWLFQRVDAAVHHGGAGTTGASLKAGLPSIIKPFFGDQFFFGSRVADLGVGILLKEMSIKSLGKALWESTHDQRMIEKAQLLGKRVKEEDGVAHAISTIFRDLKYAQLHTQGLIVDSNASALDVTRSEEHWTLVDDDTSLLERQSSGQSDESSEKELFPDNADFQKKPTAKGFDLGA